MSADGSIHVITDVITDIIHVINIIIPLKKALEGLGSLPRTHMGAYKPL